jgi:hypothetical protein
MKTKEFNDRRVALKDEVYEHLMNILPDEWVPIEIEDDAGNDLTDICRKGVEGDEGITSYPIDQLSLCDMIQILYQIEE